MPLRNLPLYPGKKPDPIIYTMCAERLGLDPSECVVVEDSMVGLNAAKAAGMRCVITYTSSTKSEAFPGAERIVAELGEGTEESPIMVTAAELVKGKMVQDDRVTGATWE